MPRCEPRAKARPVSAFLDTSRAESFAIQQTRPAFERVNSIFGMGCHLDKYGPIPGTMDNDDDRLPRLSLIFLPFCSSFQIALRSSYVRVSLTFDRLITKFSKGDAFLRISRTNNGDQKVCCAD